MIRGTQYKNFISNKQCLILILLLTLALPFVSCGREEEVPAETEYVYVPEYAEIAFPENCNIYYPKLVGNSLYYAVIQFGEGDAPNRRFLYEYSLAEEKIVREMLLGEGAGGIHEFQVTADGWAYVTDYSYGENYAGAQLLVFDEQGNHHFTKELWEIGIRSTSWAPLIDSEKRLYLPDGNKVILLDADGTLWGEVQLENCDNMLGIFAAGVGADGSVYVSYQDKESGEKLLAGIDYEAQEADRVYQNFPPSRDLFFLAGTDYDFLINDGNSLYGYTMETQSYEEILAWMDCDLNGIGINAYCSMEDGGLRVLFNSGNVESRDMVTLTPTDATTISEKTKLVIGTLSSGWELEEAVASFNRRSNTYHVTIREYDWTFETGYSDAVTALNLDITSADNCPDIIALSFLNMEALAGNDVFEDLGPWLDKSTVLDRADYIENILDNYTCNDILVTIPLSVSLHTFAAKVSAVGERSSWSLEEMLDCVGAHPEDALYNGNTKQGVLSYFLQLGQGMFIDQTNGVCSFDSEEFKRLLRLADTFPDTAGQDYRSPYDIARSGDVLLNDVTIYDIHEMQFYEALYGEDVTFIGYPTADGSGGHLFVSGGTYAIAAKSEHKEAAWSFIEHYLCGAVNSGFPTNREDLLTRATAVEYVRDDNGQLFLDSNGKPWPRYTTVNYDGREYEYHTVTEEEIAELLNLLETAKRRSSMDSIISDIITEETAPFFQGQKTVDEAAAAIQNRVQLYLNENR